MHKKITVIVPTYNDEQAIDKCLASIFANTYDNFEVIVVNDASQDKTVEVVKKYPCKIINLPERKGPGFARDRGVSLATGEVVAFLDSDCIAPKDWLSKIDCKLHRGIAGLGGKYELPVHMPLSHKLFLTYWDFRNVFYGTRRRVVSFSGGNCAFWRSVVLEPRDKKELVFFNKQAGGEDIIMCCEINAHGQLEYDPDLAVIHNKRTSLFGILRTTVWYGYTGAVFTCLYGALLSTDLVRVYKTVLFLSSLLFLFALLGAGWLPYKFLWVILFAFSLLVQSPLLVGAYKRTRLGWRVLWLPLVIYATDALHLVGNIKRISVVFLGKCVTVGWHLRFLMNFFNPRSLSSLFLFVTKKCNARCYFCFNKQNVQVFQEKADLTIEEINKIARKVDFLPFLTLTGGEPFLRDDLGDCCKAFYKNAHTRFITIATNGILSSRIIDMVEHVLLDCPSLRLTVAVALDHIGEEHEKIKGVAHGYEAVVCTLDGLDTLKRRFPNLTVILNTALLKENANRIDEILTYFLDTLPYDRQALNLPRVPARESRETDLIPTDVYCRLVQRINSDLMKDKSFFTRLRYRTFLSVCHTRAVKELMLRKPLSPCVAGKKFLVVNNCGDAYPCEILLEKMGSLREGGYNIKTIFRGSRAKKIRADIRFSECYCQWPCALISNSLFSVATYGRLFKRLFLVH